MLIITLLSVSVIIAALFFTLGKAISKKSSFDRELQSPFECGFSTFSEFRLNFSVHFFLIALIFIIFDVELIILFPNLTNFSGLIPAFSGYVYFLTLSILTYGLFNEWNQNMLEWLT